ncbi:MAG: hypothetical protein EBY62_03735 [Cellvibrionales bacterium]|nr:hypothetical protein [Cellvibrionales bacterium]
MAQECVVCKIIRTYLLFAVPLLALVGASTMDGGMNGTPWFARVELIDLLSWGCLVALVVIVVYRAYQEYYLPARRQVRMADGASCKRFMRKSGKLPEPASNLA